MRSARNILAAVCLLLFAGYFARLLYYAIINTYPPLIALAGCGLMACLVIAVILFRVARWNRRFHSLHCPECNYDLRVTPHQCPECGWASVSTESGLHPFLLETALNLSRDRTNARKK
jgi:hypothetical protein